MTSTVYSTAAIVKPYIRANGFPYSTTSEFNTGSMTDLNFVVVDMYDHNHLESVKYNLSYRLRRWTPENFPAAVYQSYSAKYDLSWFNFQATSMVMNRRDERQITQPHESYRRSHIRQYTAQHDTNGIWFNDDFIAEDDIIDDLQDELVYSELMDETIWTDDAEEIELVHPHRNRTSTAYATEAYINDHLTRCSDCRCYQENEHTVTVNMYHTVCTNCLENWTQCEECQEWTSSDESYYANDCTLCESCHDDHERSDRFYHPTLHDRYADWTPERQAKSAFPVPFAIEIEGESQHSGHDRYEALETIIDNMTAAAHDQWDKEELAYTRSRYVGTSEPDGSLSNSHGFELKTQYLRMETLRTIFNDSEVSAAYADIFDTDEMKQNEAIGLHISFPHSAMTQRGIFRLTTITDYLDNTTTGNEHAKTLFGRIPGAYYKNAARKPVKVTKGEYDGRKTGAVAIRNTSDAGAKDLSAKFGRIEIRFPRSAWTAQSLLARLELAMSLVLWALEPDPNTYLDDQESLFANYLDYHQARLTGSAIKQYRRENAKTN